MDADGTGAHRARYHADVSDARIYALNAHAHYACRHSHACCTAGWSIPVEPAKVALLGGEWLLPGEDGACPQLDRQGGRCRVHRDHGESALPDSCRHFPRRSLIDDRGTFVALSHFCPTAARLLLDHQSPLTIVESPTAFPVTREYDGLDARGEWPPLLKPGVLFDFESFNLWERCLVAALGSVHTDVQSTIEHLASVAEALRLWRVDEGPLTQWTERVLRQDAATPSATQATTSVVDTNMRRYAPYVGMDAYRIVCATIPPGLDGPTTPAHLDDVDAACVAPCWSAFAPFFGRFLGARAFASWTAYQSTGVRTQVAELVAAASVLRVECARACAESGRPLDNDSAVTAVRMTDWLLIHLADRTALMQWLATVEE